MNFLNISYLKTGNLKQQKAFEVLTSLNLFSELKSYNPILTGTIPLGIDLPESDLDIACFVKDFDAFQTLLTKLYGKEQGFKIYSAVSRGMDVTVCTFFKNEFQIEIFGQNLPSNQQMSYRHMLIEFEILNEKGEEFKQEVIKFKKAGLKTEPAFAKLLDLKGDPYEALLNLE